MSGLVISRVSIVNTFDKIHKIHKSFDKIVTITVQTSFMNGGNWWETRLGLKPNFRLHTLHLELPYLGLGPTGYAPLKTEGEGVLYWRDKETGPPYINKRDFYSLGDLVK